MSSEQRAASPEEWENEVSGALRSLASLLRQCNAQHHAGLCEKTLDLFVADRAEAMKLLLGVDFWGGSGSMSDLMISRHNGHTSNDYDRDDRLLKSFLLQVVVALRHGGYERPYLTDLENILSNWLVRQ